MPKQSTRPASTDASMLDLRAHPNAPTYKNLGGKLYPTTHAARAEAIVTLLVDRNHWHGMYQDNLDANVELAAEVKRLNGLLDDDTDSRLRGMQAAFEAAHDDSAARAITDDDPGPALGSARSWRQASEAVAKLRRGAADS